MRAGSATVIAALSLLLAADARAHEPGPAGRAVRVGLWTVGGEAVGLAAGGVAGALLGAASCGDQFECYAPLSGAIAGGGLGTAIGGAVAAGVSAHGSHSSVGRALGGGLAGLGVGAGLTIAGIAASSTPLAVTGVVVGVAGLPLGAALATGTDREVPAVSLAPVLSPGYRGIRLAVRLPAGGSRG